MEEIRSFEPAQTYDFLGVQMSVLNYQDAVDRITRAVGENQKGYVCVTGMHGILEARDRPGFQEILNRAFLCTPDGMPGVWIGWLNGHRNHNRVYGPDLMLAVMEATQGKSVRHFFYGGNEGVADELKKALEIRFPGLTISGTYCPPFRPLTAEERSALRDEMERCGADIVWVGLSTPKQEIFMAENLAFLPAKVMIGVGAAFDFHTGRARQAPYWMQRAGLEWFFRLVTEPKRLWRRYCLGVPRLISLFALDCLGLISTNSRRPELPLRFLQVESWLSKMPWLSLPAAVSLGLVAAGGGTSAFSYAGALGLSVLSMLLCTVILMAQESEERLDRPSIHFSLICFYLTALLLALTTVAPLVFFRFSDLVCPAWILTIFSLLTGLLQPLWWLALGLTRSGRKA